MPATIGAAAGNSIFTANVFAEAITIGAGSGIAVFTCHDASVSNTSITDSQGTTYTSRGTLAVTAFGEAIECWTGFPASGGATTVTLTMSGTPGDGTFAVAEIVGGNLSTPVRGSAVTNIATPGTAPDAATIGPVTVGLNDLVLAWYVDVSAIQVGDFAAGTNYTLAVQTGTGGGSELNGALISRAGLSAGTDTALATLMHNDTFAGLALALESAAAAVTPVLPPLSHTPQYQAWIAQ
jgi:hypothetical protein